jgi:hypothetical protein
MGDIDVNVPRFNQACVAALTGLAFVTQAWIIVPLVAIVLGATRFAGPRFGLFTQIYVRWLRPRRTSPVVTEPAGPPRFAQLLGVVFLGLASVLFLGGLMVAGWVVTLLVTALATLAATTRVCVGCIIYRKATT